MSPAEMLQIKVRLLELAYKLSGANSYNDTVKKYNDLCELVGIGNYTTKLS